MEWVKRKYKFVNVFVDAWTASGFLIKAGLWKDGDTGRDGPAALLFEENADGRLLAMGCTIEEMKDRAETIARKGAYSQPSPEQQKIMDALSSITPRHYTDLSPEPIAVIESWGLNFHLGNAVKYLARTGRKTEDPLEDLRKAAWYLEREIKCREHADTNPNPGPLPQHLCLCRKCGKIGPKVDEFTSPYTGLCVECSEVKK